MLLVLTTGLCSSWLERSGPRATSFTCIVCAIACTQAQFALHPLALRGLSRVGLVLLQGGALAALKDAAAAWVLKHCTYHRTSEVTISPAAIQYRDIVLDTYAAKEGRPAMVMHVAASFFNGDWRQTGSCVHFCTGCCTGKTDAASKMRGWIVRVIKALKSRVLNRGNWLAWQDGFRMVGFLMSFHGIFPDILRSYLQRLDTHESRLSEEVLGDKVEGNAAEEDAVIAMRKEAAEHCLLVATCWPSPGLTKPHNDN